MNDLLNDGTALVEQLLKDNPPLHILTEEHSKVLKDFGMDVKPGPISHAVPPEVISYLVRNVKDTARTIETGGGHTTVVLAALAQHHTCITIDTDCVKLTKEYMDRIGIPREKVTFIVESSDTALPRLSLSETFDFAFIDGGHGYPFPALDWHYIDQRLKLGGIVGLDNTEIPAVYEHTRFLDQNQSYVLSERISNTIQGPVYGASFYTKVRDDEREVFKQPYNLRRAKPLSLKERIKETIRPRYKFWPWD